jgi:hypothetical protein
MTVNTFGAATAAAHQTLTKPELERAHLYLEQTKIGVLGVLRNLSEAQWKFKPGHDRWSIGEIVEHVVIVQDRVLGPVWEKLDSAPVTDVHPDYRRIDEIVIYQFPNRLTKFPAPAQPGGDLGRTQAVERLLANYTRLGEYLEKPDLRLRAIEALPIEAISNGAYKRMDGYQWILAAAAHTERHTKQILEVMADPAFPM